MVWCGRKYYWPTFGQSNQRDELWAVIAMLIIQVRISCEDHWSSLISASSRAPPKQALKTIPTHHLGSSPALSIKFGVLKFFLCFNISFCDLSYCCLSYCSLLYCVSSSNSSSVVISRIHGSHHLSRLHINVGYKMEKVKISFWIFELLEGWLGIMCEGYMMRNLRFTKPLSMKSSTTTWERRTRGATLRRRWKVLPGCSEDWKVIGNHSIPWNCLLWLFKFLQSWDCWNKG